MASALRYIKELGRVAREEMGTLFPSSKRRKGLPLDFVCFGITDRCILQCKMCNKWQEDIFIKEKKEPKLQDWKRCISSLSSIKNRELQINFGGGEPLLHELTLKLVSFCREKGLKTNIATNGYLIDEDMAKGIADSGLDSIIISLDSLKEETHDYLRGINGVWRQVMRSIELLDKYCNGLFKGICCVIYNKNIDGVLELARWVEHDSRINSIYFMAAMQPNNTPIDYRWFEKEEFSLLWPQDTPRVCAIIDELIELKKQDSKITNQLTQLKAFKSYYQNPVHFVKNSKCNMDLALHISSNGDIFLCYRWAQLGNIATDDIASLWHSTQANRIRQDIGGCKSNCHFLLNCFFKEEYPFKITTHHMRD